jgi:hypothetical protein
VTLAVTVGVSTLIAIGFVAAWPLLGHLDNHTGGDMSLRESLRDAVRHYLGTAHIDTIPDRLHRMEQTMATWTTVLNGLVEQTTAASAAQATSFSNLQGAINRQTEAIADLQRQLAEAGEVTPEMQARVAEISAALDDMKKAADTADNGFEPVDEAPEQPSETPDNEVPVEEQPTTPGVEVPPTDQPADTPDDGTARR